MIMLSFGQGEAVRLTTVDPAPQVYPITREKQPTTESVVTRAVYCLASIRTGASTMIGSSRGTRAHSAPHALAQPPRPEDPAPMLAQPAHADCRRLAPKTQGLQPPHHSPSHRVHRSLSSTARPRHTSTAPNSTPGSTRGKRLHRKFRSRPSPRADPPAHLMTLPLDTSTPRRLSTFEDTRPARPLLQPFPWARLVPAVVGALTRNLKRSLSFQRAGIPAANTYAPARAPTRPRAHAPGGVGTASPAVEGESWKGVSVPLLAGGFRYWMVSKVGGWLR